MTTMLKYEFGETPAEVIRKRIKNVPPDSAPLDLVDDDLITILEALLEASWIRDDDNPNGKGGFYERLPRGAGGPYNLRIEILAALGIDER